jgi:hypothetical protein
MQEEKTMTAETGTFLQKDGSFILKVSVPGLSEGEAMELSEQVKEFIDNFQLDEDETEDEDDEGDEGRS